VDSAVALPVDRYLDDGTYLSSLELSRGPVPVRVIDDAVRNGDGYEPIRLVTTITEPSQAPAYEFAKVWAGRWPVATTMTVIKEAEPGKAFLRSQTPSAIYQEAWALLCVYQTTIGTLRRASDWQQQPGGRSSPVAAQR
jgi:hypothetical protein